MNPPIAKGTRVSPRNGKTLYPIKFQSSFDEEMFAALCRQARKRELSVSAAIRFYVDKGLADDGEDY